MTSTEQALEGAVLPPVSDSETLSDQSGVNTPDNENQGSKEAKYRVERNEARQERDELAARLAALQTTEMLRQAGEILSAPEDIILAGKTLSDFLTPEGWVDKQAVTAAAKQVLAQRPGLKKLDRAVDITQGSGSVTAQPQPSFADMFRR